MAGGETRGIIDVIVVEAACFRDFYLPQIVTDFYDKLKSITSGESVSFGFSLLCCFFASTLLISFIFPGYASFDYEPTESREADVVMV